MKESYTGEYPFVEDDRELCISCDELTSTHNICMDCIGKMIKENQQEISDEEILKAAKECRFEDFDISVGSFELGARWYREQLKLKQIKKD